MRSWLACRIPACAGMTVLLLLAQTAQAAPYTYAPPNCDFRIDFPSEPAEGKRCDPADPTKCNPVTTFTHVFGLDATVNFNVTCNPAAPGMYEKYTGDVMRATLDAMVGKGKLDHYETGFKQFDVAKQATIIGTGRTGESNKIYIAQLWIGHATVFTVEGELVGEQGGDADKMFADILRSIRYKDWKATTAGPVPSTDKAATGKSTPALTVTTPASQPASAP